MARFMGDTPRKLADYHETLGIADADLTPCLRAIRANPEVSVGKQESKTMRNAAVAPLIEEVFAKLHALIQVSPETHGLKEPDDEPEEPEDAMHETYMLLHGAFDEVCERHAQEKTAAYRTLSEYYLGGGMDDMVPFFPVRIQAGLRNANTVSWRMIEAVPKVFRAERGERISAEEWEAVCRRNIEMLTDLSRMHLSAFSLLMSHTGGSDRQEAFKTEELTVADGSLRIREELIMNVLGMSDGFFAGRKPQPATGCPALFAHSPDGHGNVIQYLHRWHLDVARKYIFPRWERKAQDSVSSER